MSQAERRKQYLELQKKRRYDYQNYCRKLADPDSHFEDVEKCENIQEDMEWDTSKKKTGPTYKNQIMLSEWLIEMPEDFDSNWLIVPCPQGKRCLMVASRACTKVFSKSGFLITKFQSLLPGGHFQSPSDNTILDCLWSEVKQCYYVLDILSWSGLPLLGCEAQFRFYWLKSKFNECPQLQLKSSRNVYPLIPLPSSSCVKENIETLMMIENQMWNPLDGLLFYHKLGFYTPNVTPLVGWLKPFMIPEILGMKIPEFYAKAQPVNYVNIKEYLKKKPQKTLKEIFRVV